jgi:hypothetical protein
MGKNNEEKEKLMRVKNCPSNKIVRVRIYARPLDLERELKNQIKWERV